MVFRARESSLVSFEERLERSCIASNMQRGNFGSKSLTRVDLAAHDTYVEMQSDGSKMMEQFIHYYYYKCIYLGEIKLGEMEFHGRAIVLTSLETP